MCVCVCIFETKETHMCMCSVTSHVKLLTALWTASCQAPLSIGYSRQGYWIGLPFLLPGNVPDPEVETVSAALEDEFFTTELLGKPKETHTKTYYN